MIKEKIILYSNSCPRCLVLEKKLAEKNIAYEKVTDIDAIVDKGFSMIPMLEMDGEAMDFLTSIKWINERE